MQLQRSLEHVLDGSLGMTVGLFYSLLDGQVLDHRLDTLQTIEPSPGGSTLCLRKPTGHLWPRERAPTMD